MGNVTAPKKNVNTISREEVRAIAREEFRNLLAAAVDPRPAVYTTRLGKGPDGVTDEYWKTIAPTVPGAVKLPGERWWRVPRAAWEAYEMSQALAPLPQATAASADEEPWSPSGALASVGLRRIK